jgi:integrase/recombinase XerD
VSSDYVGRCMAVRGPLRAVAEGFAEVLDERGYSPRTIETQMRMLRDLSEWLDDHGVALAGLADDVVEAYVSERRLRTPTLRSARAVAPLLGHLRGMGVVPVARPVVAAEGTPGRILADFEEYLLSKRGLSAATVRSYCSQVRPLVSSCDGDGCASLSAEKVRRFIDERAATDKPRSVQVRINAVRALLSWLWRRRLIVAPLHEHVLPMFAPGGPPLPRGLSAAELRALHEALSADPAARVRDAALVALMLRLGLRSGEAASLCLEDIDWRGGTLTVVGKGGRLDRLPLPDDVGTALVAYLRDGRPGGTEHRQVFLSIDAPHGPIGRAAVSSMVGRAVRRAGITGQGAAHRLRHSAALRVIAGGGGLVEAGQLLRHSSVSATGIYARVDVAALAVLARRWPEAGK